MSEMRAIRAIYRCSCGRMNAVSAAMHSVAATVQCTKCGAPIRVLHSPEERAWVRSIRTPEPEAKD